MWWNQLTGTYVCQVGKGCWIHSHKECPAYDTKQSDCEARVMLELWEMQSTPSLPSLPGPFWPGAVAPDRVISMGQIELNCVFMLNWIAWNRTVLTFKLLTWARLNCLKWICLCTLNWIVWNRIVLTFNCEWTKAILILNWIVWIGTVWLKWIAWNRNVFDNETVHSN